jgi:hypothetical protein
MSHDILNFEEINQKFVDWFRSNGGMISQKIAFKDYSSDNAGRGVVAVDDIQVCYFHFFKYICSITFTLCIH